MVNAHFGLFGQRRGKFKTRSLNLLPIKSEKMINKLIFKINTSDISAVKQTQLAENHESNIENEVTSQVPAERERRFFNFFKKKMVFIHKKMIECRPSSLTSVTTARM